MDQAEDLRTETARALSAARLCEGCGTPLVGGRSHRRYCDAQCRAHASRARLAHTPSSIGQDRQDGGPSEGVDLEQQPSPGARLTLEHCGDVLTLEDMASVLVTSSTTIKRRLRAGTFPIRPLVGIDRRRRWSRMDVRRYLDGTKTR